MRRIALLSVYRALAARLAYRAFLTLTFCAPLAAQAAALPKPGNLAGTGVNIAFTEAKPGELEMLKAGGFKYVRRDFSWDLTERKRGVYDFTVYDRLLASLERYGLSAIFILDYANPVYEPLRSVRTEEGRRAFAHWAAAAVTHFKGRGICWELWNEPNLDGFWQPAANAAEYVDMALVAAKTIRAAQPKEIIVGPATSGVDSKFLKACFDAGLLNYWDAVTVHPYRQGPPETVEHEYANLRDQIARHSSNGKAVSILSGEWGYSSIWAGFDKELQGKMLVRQYLVNAACGVPISIWYDWHDDGESPGDPEHRFGTVEWTYHEGRFPVYDPKPAYLAAQTLHAQLRGYRLVKRLALGNGERWGLLFEKDGGLVLVAWGTNPREVSVQLPSAEGKFRVTDHLGRHLPETVTRDGLATFRISDGPRYFEFVGVNDPLRSSVEATPMRVSVRPVSGNEVVVDLQNYSGSAHEVRVSLNGDLKAEVLVHKSNLPAASGIQTVRFPLRERPSGEYRLGIDVESMGVVQATVEPRIFFPIQPDILVNAEVAGDGDPKVVGDFRLSEDPLSAASPDGEKSMELHYSFGSGWKFARIHPKTSATAPVAVAAGKGPGDVIWLSLWIYGNGSNLEPRVRIQDAVHRTWQPAGPRIDWHGWRYVEVRLDANTPHWGGSPSPDTRSAPIPPLLWEELLVLDNPRTTSPSEGIIHFTMPSVSVAAPPRGTNSSR